MARLLFLLACLLLILTLSSCAADHVDIAQCAQESPDGFWLGLWHGVIAPVTFIISLFSDSVEMYSINNNGGWYNFGFVLGAGILTVGSSKA
jgi:hypothetical protein